MVTDAKFFPSHREPASIIDPECLQIHEDTIQFISCYLSCIIFVLHPILAVSEKDGGKF